MEMLLSIDPAERGSAALALESEFFTTKPLPCDPSSLPKYPPSKELDAKLRDEEARRQGVAGNKDHRLDLERKVARESRAIPAPDANAELVISIQKRQAQSNSRSRSEKFNTQQEEVASGFPFEPRRPSQSSAEGIVNPEANDQKKASHPGPLAHLAAWPKAGKNIDNAPKTSTAADFSTMPGLVAARRSLLLEDQREKLGHPLQAGATKLIARFPSSFKETSSPSIKKQDQKHQIDGDDGSHQNDYGRTSSKDPVLHGSGSKGNKIHYSGPLLVPSGMVDQMLKDHDRQIQEAVRQARLDKARRRKMTNTICADLACKNLNNTKLRWRGPHEVLRYTLSNTHHRSRLNYQGAGSTPSQPTSFHGSGTTSILTNFSYGHNSKCSTLSGI
ncbi:hypothetical protein Nepgr_026121 [Nepenthes gracilis]|uniref:Uncharacterized protein n=1 Tax=Nepenthes gracilis TaxID=150966 RepID=A0AAD3T7F5_NEPGR|nr:hypothetical protein Nepgr_026121 [Nepenthes gracilis]